MNLEDCLPPELVPATITRIGVGMSGAGVYRVVSGGTTCVLKVAPETQPFDEWRSKVTVQRAAAAAGAAPRIIHVDEGRRAVVSEHIVDRGFAMRFWDPATREGAVSDLGSALRRVHDVPMPTGTTGIQARDGLGFLWSGLAGFPLPAFAGPQIERMLAETPPAPGPTVLSHNDANPSNLAYDGERVLLLDWDTAGPNDSYYDLATAALFLRFDDATCAQLIAVHDQQPADATLPARFLYLRRLVATLCGTMMVHILRQGGHAGATEETLESIPSLVEFYGRMRTGAVDMATVEGRWEFGLALLKTATTL